MKTVARFIIRAVLGVIATAVTGAIALLVLHDGETFIPNVVGIALGLLISWFCSDTEIGRSIVRLYKIAFKLGQFTLL